MDVIDSGPWAKGGGLFATALTEEQIIAHRNKS